MMEENTTGIPWCINCSGYHPYELPTKKDIVAQMLNPQRAVFKKAKSIETKKHLYKNKACGLCGRAYDHSGNLDESWDLTARLVKKEFDHAGVFGLCDSKVKLAVADCRKSVTKLFKLIPQFQAIVNSGKRIHKDDLALFETLSFSGRLSLIIENAQETRKLKIKTM